MCYYMVTYTLHFVILCHAKMRKKKIVWVYSYKKLQPSKKQMNTTRNTIVTQWLICRFKMAAKMADLCSKLHIFLSAVNNLDCMGLFFSHVPLLDVFLPHIYIWLICIFNMAAKIAST